MHHQRTTSTTTAVVAVLLEPNANRYHRAPKYEVVIYRRPFTHRYPTNNVTSAKTTQHTNKRRKGRPPSAEVLFIPSETQVLAGGCDDRLQTSSQMCVNFRVKITWCQWRKESLLVLYRQERMNAANTGGNSLWQLHTRRTNAIHTK